MGQKGRRVPRPAAEHGHKMSPSEIALASHGVKVGGFHQTTSLSVGGFKLEPADAAVYSVVRNNGIGTGKCQ